jgi:hypothetical protein
MIIRPKKNDWNRKIMTSRDFCFWLQGFLEISKSKKLTEEQVKMIQKHLNLVFKHEIDPSMENQEELNTIHGNRPPFDGTVRC